MNPGEVNPFELTVAKSNWSVISPLKLAFLCLPLILGIALAIVLESAWPLLLLGISLFTAGVIAIQILLLKFEVVKVYPDRLVFRSGFLSPKERTETFSGIRSTEVHQTLLGNLLHYGTVQLNPLEMGIIKITNVRDPLAVKQRLDNMLIHATGTVRRMTIL